MRRARPLRRHVQQDWIVAIVDRLDANDGLLVGGTLGPYRVVAGPFPERTFEPGFYAWRRHFAFDDNLCMRRNRQSSKRAFDHFNWTPKHAADAIKLGHAEWKFRIGEKEQQRIAAESDDHRTGFPFLPVPLRNESALLPGTLPYAEQIALVHLHAIGPHIDIAGLRVTIDESIAGSDVAAAIALVRLQHGKAQQIDFIVTHDVLHDRAGLDLLGRNWLGMLDAVRGVLHDLHARRVGWKAERQTHANPRCGRNAQHPETLGVVLDLVEHQRWRLID